MSEGEVPEGRCGFILEPVDVHEDVAEVWGIGADEWYEVSEAVCCWREPWGRAESDRCIWHVETDDKSAEELIEARVNGPERLDGAYVPAVALGDAIDFEDCGLRSATFRGTDLLGVSFAQVDGHYIQFPDANLAYAQFADAQLLRAQFSDANLHSAQFPNASLSQAKFWDADLMRAEFPDAELMGAQFSGTSLREVEFPDAYLRGAEFSHAHLQDAQFPDAELMHAEFPNADLTDSDLTDAEAGDTDFTSATLERATFINVDLSDTNLTDARLHETHLLDARINARTDINEMVPEEADADWFAAADLSPLNRFRWWLTWWRADPNTLDDHRDQLDRAHTVYRTIQRLYRENSMPEEIDEYHVRAKDVRRKQAIIDSAFWRWLYLAGQRWVMRYGEQPLRVVATSVAVVLLTTLLYPVWGLSVGKAHEPSARVIAYPFDSVGVLTGLGKSLYFSVITFTTLGYGDVQPVGFGELLATMESFGGAFLMALLVYVLGRRATR